MKNASKLVLGSCLSLLFCALPAHAMTMEEVSKETAGVLAACKAEAASLKGYDLQKSVLKCQKEKTSPEAKAFLCEQQMIGSMPRKFQSDAELKAGFIKQCVETWNPKIK